MADSFLTQQPGEVLLDKYRTIACEHVFCFVQFVHIKTFQVYIQHF
jgi:hypothetical protein